jgi:hypothetical protein
MPKGLTPSTEPTSQHRLISPFVLPTHTEQGLLIIVVVALVLVFQIDWQESHIAEKHFDDLTHHVIEAMGRSQTDYSPGDYSAAVPDSRAFVLDLLGWAAFALFLTTANYLLQTWKIQLLNLFKLIIPTTFREFRFPASLQELRLRWTRSSAKLLDSKLDEELRLLSRRADIQAPALEFGNKWNLRTAQVSGSSPFVISLQPGFRILYRSKPDEARAVLLHELAHIRNGDVRRGWIAAAAVYGTVGTATVNCLYKVVGISSWVGQVDLGPEVYTLAIITAVLLLFFYSRFLRAREVYADYRVRDWGAGDALYTILASAAHAATENRRMPLPLRKNDPGWFSFHPSADTRLGYLLNPRLFFDIPSLDMFGLGALIGIAISGVVLFFVPMIVLLAAKMSFSAGITNSDRLILLSLVLIVDLFFSYSLIATMGTAVQRQALAVLALKKKRTGRKNLTVAFSMSIGIYLGMQLAYLPIGPISEGRMLIWLSASTLSLWFIISFLHLTSKCAFKRALSKKVLRFRARLIRSMGTLMLATLFPFLILLGSKPSTHSSKEVLATVAGLLFVLFVYTYCALWLLTLILILLIWRRNKAQCPHCHAKDPRATFASNCKSCNGDMTPWATTESLGQLGAHLVDSVSPSPVEHLEMGDDAELRQFSEFESELVTAFAGQNMSVSSLYEMFHPRHSRQECLDALEFLERARAIIVDPERRHRESTTIPEGAMIYFPRKRLI